MSFCGCARRGRIVRTFALSVAAIAIMKCAKHVERTVELIDPLIVAHRPHRDGLRPAVWIELDINNIFNRRCGWHRHLKENW